MRQANRAVIRERHIIPKIEDILTELHGATIFSKIDLKEGYHQIMLNEESRNITAFAVHEGIFRFKRLIYGINSGFECFQKQIEQVISGIPNPKNVSDDILIWGKAQEDHDSTLSNILKRIKDSGLKVNPSKCVFSVNKITFGGHVLSKEGILLDPNKISAIQDIQTPSSVTQVKSFLGMTNFCNRFIPNYSTITEPLRNLTRKDTIFTWERHHQEAFDTLKSLLVNATTVAFYNPDATTQIITDASPVGLGAILAQQQENGEYKPIAYGSRALTNTETRYSQTEKEALAVTWSCQHFHYYIYDRHVTIITDHKPLEKLLSAQSNPPPRIQRWVLRLQSYNYTIKYSPGSSNPADCLSRNRNLTKTTSDENIADLYINHVTSNAVPVSMSLEEIEQHTLQDKILQRVTQSLTSNWDKQFKPYFTIRDHNNILLKENQIIIPSTLTNKILQIAHQQHQGITKTKALLRTKVWWPAMNQDVENLIRHCHTCQVITPSTTSRQPLQMTNLPTENWEYLSTDLKGPLHSGEYILALIDYRTKYPVVAVMR